MFGGFNLGGGFQLPDLSDTLLKLQGAETDGVSSETASNAEASNTLTEGFKNLTGGLHNLPPLLGPFGGSARNSTAHTPAGTSSAGSKGHSPVAQSPKAHTTPKGPSSLAAKLASPPSSTPDNTQGEGWTDGQIGGWGLDEEGADTGGWDFEQEASLKLPDDLPAAKDQMPAALPPAQPPVAEPDAPHIKQTIAAQEGEPALAQLPAGNGSIPTVITPELPGEDTGARPGSQAPATPLDVPHADSPQPHSAAGSNPSSRAASPTAPQLAVRVREAGPGTALLRSSTPGSQPGSRSSSRLGSQPATPSSCAADAEQPAAAYLHAQQGVQSKHAPMEQGAVLAGHLGVEQQANGSGPDDQQAAESDARGVGDDAQEAAAAHPGAAVEQAGVNGVVVTQQRGHEVTQGTAAGMQPPDPHETTTAPYATALAEPAGADSLGVLAAESVPVGAAEGPEGGVEGAAGTEAVGAPPRAPEPAMPPLEDLSRLEAPALRELVAVLREALDARQAALELRTEELSNQKTVVMQLTAKNAEMARRTAKLSEDDYEQLRVEFEERLAAAERKAYALAKERDALRRGTEKLNSVNELVKAKDEMIKELMDEGERLSKRQLANENTTKKLRTQIEQLERERVRLSALSGEQNGKIETLGREKAMLENQIQNIMEHHRQQLDQERRNAAADLAAARRAQTEAEAAAANAARDDAAHQLRETTAQLAVLEETVQELQGALEQNRRIANTREDALKREIASLEERCQEANMRHEELAAKLPETTGPLVRQIEALQAAASQQATAWQLTERTLMSRLNEAEARAAAAVQRERSMQERVSALQSSAVAAEGALEAAQSELQELRAQVESEGKLRKQAERQCEALEAKVADVSNEMHQNLADKADVVTMLEQQLDALQAQNVSLAKKVRDLEDRLTTSGLRERSPSTLSHHSAHNSHAPALAAPGYKWVLLKESEAAALANGSGPGGQGLPNGAIPGPLGPQGSLPRNDSHHSAASGGPGWRTDDRRTHSLGGEPTSPAQGARSTQVLLQQVADLEASRDRMSEELLRVQRQLESMSVAQGEVVELQRQLQELAQERAALVELLGEKTERLEEALADLEDVKGMMKQQTLYVVDSLQKAGINDASAILGGLHQAT